MIASIEPMTQKDQGDCGIAALAMILQKPYRDVSEIALKLIRRPHKTGLYITDAFRIAAKFGIEMRQLPDPRLQEEATGLLNVRRGKGKKAEAHMAAMFQGVVIDPADGLLWDLDTYLLQGKWKITAILERVE